MILDLLVVAAIALSWVVLPYLAVKADRRSIERRWWMTDDGRRQQDQALALLNDPAPLTVDPRPMLREEMIQMNGRCGHQWRGRDACPEQTRADGPHECVDGRLIHSRLHCWCPCGEVGDLARCRDLRRDGRYGEICAGCAPTLVGTAANLPRTTP